MAPSVKLTYFPIPGRAEATRILLSYGGIPFDDVHVQFKEWGPEQKAKTLFGQLPVLEVDGKELVQSAAIERYCAKLAGVYPTDAWEAAKQGELTEFYREIVDLFVPTKEIQDIEARKKARSDIAHGAVGTKLAKLQQLLGDKQYFSGSKPMFADFVIYAGLSHWTCGLFEGIPTNLLDDYPVLKAHHNRMASLPAVAKRYESVQPGELHAAYKVLP